MQTIKSLAQKSFTIMLYGAAIALGTLLAFIQTQTRKEVNAPLIQEFSFTDTAHADAAATGGTSCASSSSTSSSGSTGSSTG